MGLNGSLATVPVPDLLQLLGSTGKTGLLHVYRSGDWKKIYLVNGLVSVISSSDPEEYVGNSLVALGKIDTAELRRVLEIQTRERRLVGLVLVSQGRIDDATLRRRLNDRAFDVVAKLLSWTDAMFNFEEYEQHRCQHIPLNLSVEQVLMEGMRRADELARFREYLPSIDTMIERADDTADDTAEGDLEQSMVGIVLDKLDKPRTVEELKRELKVSEYAVLDSLVHMMQKGVLRRAHTRHEPPPTRPWLVQAKQFVASGHFEQAMLTLRDGLRDDPTDTAARRLLEQAEEKFITSLMAKELPADAIPEMLDTLDSLMERSLSPTEAFLLSRITGEADIQTLVEAVPLRPAETLLTMRRLVRAGYLSLRRK